MTQNFVTVNGISAPEGRQIKARMTLLGLRVEDVAAAVGMGRPTLYRVLAGTRALSDDERARLLEALTRLGSSSLDRDGTAPDAGRGETSPTPG